MAKEEFGKKLRQPSEYLILIVDDDDNNVSIISNVLKSVGYRFESVSNGDQAMEWLQHNTPDLVLLDYEIPGRNSLETLKELRRRQPYSWVIFISPRNDAKIITRCLMAGGDDYVFDPFDPIELLARIRTQLRMKDLTDDLAAANQHLRELADIDDLTGLFNMRSIYQKIEIEISRARRYKRAVAVIMLDMDHFKKVNDNHDHLFGSFVLSEVGKLIRESIRNLDFAARYGGDEFLIVLSEPTIEGAATFTDRFRQKIADYTFIKDSDTIRLTTSLGLAVYEPATRDIDAKSLVRFADHALYEAKNSGRNCFKMSTLTT